VFKTRDVPELGLFATTLLASVVAKEEEIAWRARRLVLNTAPRWQAAWWPKRKKSRGGHNGWF